MTIPPSQRRALLVDALESVDEAVKNLGMIDRSPLLATVFGQLQNCQNGLVFVLSESSTKDSSCMEMTAAQKEEQRRSFAFGNARISNDLVSRKMIDEVAKVMPE